MDSFENSGASCRECSPRTFRSAEPPSRTSINREDAIGRSGCSSRIGNRLSERLSTSGSHSKVSVANETSGEPLKECAEAQHALQAGDGRSQAVVDGVAEADVSVRAACDVERLRRPRTAAGPGSPTPARGAPAPLARSVCPPYVHRVRRPGATSPWWGPSKRRTLLDRIRHPRRIGGKRFPSRVPCSRIAFSPLARRLRVVSCPAKSRSTQVATISCSSSASPRCLRLDEITHQVVAPDAPGVARSPRAGTRRTPADCARPARGGLRCAWRRRQG